MASILELLMQQHQDELAKGKKQPVEKPIDMSLLSSLIAQTQAAHNDQQQQAAQGQNWLDRNSPEPQDALSTLATIQRVDPYYGKPAPKGVIGGLVGQILNGIGSGIAEGAGNLLKEKVNPKPNDNELILKLLGTPNTVAGAGEWHAPLRQGETIQGNGTGMAGGELSPMEAGLGMMLGQDPNTRETGGNIVQQFLTPREAKQAKAPTMRTMGVPGMEGYRQNFYLDANNNPVAVGEPWKATGLTIQMGDQQNISPATPEQKRAFGLDPKAPAVYDLKTGEVKPITVPQGPKPTEDQQKTGMYLQGMVDSYHRIERALELYGDIGKPQFTDRLGAAVGSQADPESVSGQFSKNVKSDKWQAIEQANAEFGNYALKTLTGAGQSEGEARETIKSMLPALGDPPNIQEAKRAARQTIIKSAGARAGGAAPTQPRQPVPVDPVAFKRAGKSYQEYLNAVRGQ